MATIPRRLVEGTLLGTAAATLYAAPGLTRSQIKKLTLTNTSASPVTATVYLVPSGGAAGTANTLTYQRTIPGAVAGAVSTLELYEAEGHVLETGDFLAALASVAAVVALTASGAEIQ